jgi:ribulose-phosphate 3-epimerase
VSDYRLDIAASVLDSDLGRLADEVKRAVDAGADRIHLDVMDGHFVPNLTFGWKTIEALRGVTKLPFDAHLMISEPGRWVDAFVDAGCDSITFHVEVQQRQIRPALERIRERGRLAGLAVKPATPLTSLKRYHGSYDIVLVMTVEPGFGGQRFMDDVAATKIAPARDFADYGVHIDGGGNSTTAARVGAEGGDVLIIGSALFRTNDMAGEIDAARRVAKETRERIYGSVAS